MTLGTKQVMDAASIQAGANLIRSALAPTSTPTASSFFAIPRTAENVRTPSGGRTTKVSFPVSNYGIGCICYENPELQELAATHVSYDMLATCGNLGSRRQFVCGCQNAIPGSGMTRDQLPQMVVTPEFKSAAGSSLCAALGLDASGTPLFLDESKAQKGINWLVIGTGALILGGGFLWWLMARRKHSPSLESDMDKPNLFQDIQAETQPDTEDEYA